MKFNIKNDERENAFTFVIELMNQHPNKLYYNQTALFSTATASNYTKLCVAFPVELSGNVIQQASCGVRFWSMSKFRATSTRRSMLDK